MKAFHHRILGGVLFVFLATVFVTAFYLEPDPFGTGVGTHVLLGMGECSFLRRFAFPCPFCGLTTTFSYLAHFQMRLGFLNQPFGFFLFFASLALMVIGFFDMISPRGRIWKIISWIRHHELMFSIGFLISLMLGWFYKILSMS